ncbi:MAG: guanylate kinase [Halobacteriovoraceae bacterium]|nr:guanylate kinase [Halobacteriovoraceae bacterium]
MKKMEKRGHIIIIVAPSGTGKSTLLKMLFEQFPQLHWSVSTTTRDKRPGEVEGKDYFYTTVEKFKKGIEAEDFAEWAEVHNNYYGTSKKTVEHALENGNIVVCDLDVQGTDSMLQSFPDDTTAIFIEPPSIEDLEKRLRKRATDNTQVIETRLKNAAKELQRKNDFHYLAKNENLEQCYKDLVSIFTEILEQRGSID